MTKIITHDFACIYIDNKLYDFAPLRDILLSKETDVLIARDVPEAIDLVRKESHRLIAIISPLKIKDDKHGAFKVRRRTTEFKDIPLIITANQLNREELMEAICLGVAAIAEEPFAGNSNIDDIKSILVERQKSIVKFKASLTYVSAESQLILDELENELLKLEESHFSRDMLYVLLKGAHNINTVIRTVASESTRSFCDQFENFISKVFNHEFAYELQTIKFIFQAHELLRDILSSEKINGDNSQVLNFFSSESLGKYEIHECSPNLSDSDEAVDSKPALESSNYEAKFTKVAVTSLERMAHFSGESTIQKNIIAKILGNLQRKLPNDHHLNELNEHFWELAKLQGSLQDEVGDIRSTPFSDVCRPLPRLIQEYSKGLKKNIGLRIKNAEIGVDPISRRVLEDSLIHIVYNAIEHGFENAEERVRSGKGDRGLITIEIAEDRVFHYVKISDDGRGIDRDRILQKALKKGFINTEEAGKLTNDQILSLIFLPGYNSSSENSHSVKGSVGLDTVKANLEKSGGFIEIQSEIGKGTSFTLILKKPDLSVSHEAVLVGVGDHSLAIPQSKVLRLIKVDEAVRKKLYHQHGTCMLQIDNLMTPLFHLQKILNKEKKAVVEESDFNDSCYLILVKDIQERRFIVLVDDVFDIEELVIRALPAFVSSQGIFKGAALLGSSNLGLVLDIDVLGKVFSDTKNQGGLRASILDSQDESATLDSKSIQNLNLVIFSTARFGLLAIEYKYLYRIEKISPSHFRKIGNWDVLIYQNHPQIINSLDDIIDEKVSAIAKPGMGEMNRDQSGTEELAVLMLRYASIIYSYRVSKVLDITDVSKSTFIPGNNLKPIFKSFFYYNKELVALIDERVLVQVRGVGELVTEEDIGTRRVA